MGTITGNGVKLSLRWIGWEWVGIVDKEVAKVEGVRYRFGNGNGPEYISERCRSLWMERTDVMDLLLHFHGQLSYQEEKPPMRQELAPSVLWKQDIFCAGRNLISPKFLKRHSRRPGDSSFERNTLFPTANTAVQYTQYTINREPQEQWQRQYAGDASPMRSHAVLSKNRPSTDLQHAFLPSPSVRLLHPTHCHLKKAPG